MSRTRVKLTDRLLSIVLSIMMVVAMIPVTSLSAFAATNEHPDSLTVSVTSGTEKISGASVKITNTEYSLDLSATTDINGVAAFETTDIENVLQSNTLDQISAVITVTKDGYDEKVANSVISADNLTADIEVEIVEATPSTTTVSVVVTGEATVEIDGSAQTSATVEVGAQVPIKIAPAAGSYIKELKISENTVPVTKGNAYEGTVQVDEALTITATVVKEFTVFAQANEGGTVKINGNAVSSVTVDENAEVSLDVTAKEGYQISFVSIGGVPQMIENTTTFSEKISVTGNTDVDVVFVKVYTITVTHNENGTVVTTPATTGGSVTVESNKSVIVVATPENNFRVSKVEINGVEDTTVTGANNSGYNKTLTADADYTVEITFAPNVFSVTKGQTNNGLIALGADSVEYNGSCDVTVTPNAGYSVTSVKVNGNNITTYDDTDGVIEFTVENITENTNIVATFAETEKSTVDVKTLFNSSDSLRTDAYIFAKNATVTFATDKDGIILYDKTGAVIGGGKSTKTVTISKTTEIARIELVYQAETEMAVMAHEVIGVSVETMLKVVIDTDKAECKLTPNAANENGYYNSDVTFAVKAEDKGDYSGIALVEYWITLNGVEGKTTKLYEYESGDPKAVYEDTITVDASVYNSKDVKVTLHVLDRAGNEETISKDIKINSTNPTVSLAINGTQNENAKDTYYNDQRTLTITVVDREDTFSKVNIAKGFELYKDGQRVTVAATDITWKHTDGSNQYEGTYVFSADAHYKWNFTYTNLAGLSNEGVSVDGNSKDIYEFYVDKAEPYNLAITYSPTFVDVLFETVTFGFYKAPVEVTIEAVDDTAGIDSFSYTYGDVSDTISGSDIQRSDDKAVAKFTIPAQFRGTVSFTATDRAGRKTELSDSKVVVIDTIAPGVTVKWDPAEGQNGKYFSADRTATIEIDEANFFAQDLEDGLLKITADIIYNDGTTDSKTYKPEFTQVNEKYVATITFTEEADYSFGVVYTDRSGNTFDEYPAEEFTIDKTTPVISVEYDNNSAVNGNYFKEERNATITVVEHNFNAAAMNVLVNETPMQVTWTKADDAADTYTAEVPFAGDAHYIFSVYGKDFANNANVGVDTAEDTVAPWNFTVDKSSPKDLKISYEPTFTGTLLEGLTFGFYKAPVTVKLEATDDISGIDFFTYSYTVQEGASAVNTDKKDVKVDANGKSFITFDIPAQFRGFVSFTATNKSGVSASTADENAVVVDDIAPGVQVVYGNYDAVNDKYYKADRTATITIDEANYFEDDIKDGLLVITRKAIANDGTVNEETLTPTFTKIAGSDKYTATITFDQDADYTFDIKYTDRAGNVYDDYTADEFTVDKIKPIISIEKANGAYFNADRTAKITVVEHNFRASDFEFTAEAYNVLGKVEANKIDLSSKDYQNYLKNQDNWTKVAADTWEAEITFDIEGNYAIGATYSDLAGNEQVEAISDTFCVDKTRPVIDVTYDNNSVKNSDQFKENRTATIKITEHNFRADYVVAKVMANGNEVTSYADYLKDDANWTHNGDVHTAVIEYREEAHYTFEIACTDKAGNPSNGVNYGESKAPTRFTLDKNGPTEMDIKIADKSVKGSMKTHAFDTFYGEAVTVKLSANCDISGLESFKYQKVADIGDYKADGEWTDYNAETGIVVNPSEKFVIYFRAEDRAGHVEIIRSTGIVVDNQKPVGETNAPEIDILPATPNANGMHNGDVNVDLKVVDPKYVGATAADNGHYSGLNKITYKIYTTDTDAVEEGTLFERTTKTDGAVFDNDKLVSSWTGKITVSSEKFNSNNVIVEVTAIDNAGNTRTTTTQAGDIKIDITAPTIVVSYDNNDADSSTFFKADRTATVVITERNFNAKDVVVTITNTDGTVPTISEFTKKNGTGNGDDITWTATIKYTADGDYTFDIAYTDLADNKCSGETFAEGTVASNEFTIDKTVPVISVSYDNNDAQNGNYYKAVRTATVVITEHNFNPERVTITHTATDDGADTTKPTVSSWSSNGDKHTATIYYGKDAKYTFDIAMNDKAGNASADYTEETFFVDMTMPTLEISGVANNSANKGDVIPVVSYSDTNYDADKVTITLTGANRKAVELDGSYADIHNGRTFTFKNFAEEKAIDDIYTLTATLTDKAGNTTTQTVTFSVNRFGSTYALSDAAEQLNGTYVKEPVDVVLTETNADELSNIKITLFKDGEATVLKEGTDYKIEVVGGNGQWFHYTYTIFAENFAADGVYSLTIESDDKAGNAAKNDQDTKNTAINFGVDSTLPIINIENLESKTTYALDNMTVKMSVKDNLKLTKVIVELDGKEYKSWSDEELEAIIQNGGNFTFDISGDSTDAHNLVVYAIDAAGNGEKISDTELPANAEKVEDFYVTTNLWVRYYTNKLLFFGSIAGVIVLAGLIVTLVVYKKKKNEKN